VARKTISQRDFFKLTLIFNFVSYSAT